MLEAFLNIKTKQVIAKNTKGIFSPLVSLVNVNTLKKIFEKPSKLQVVKCLVVHVLSSSFNVSRLELQKEGKATQHWNFCVTNDIVLSQVCVYHERLYAYNVVS